MSSFEEFEVAEDSWTNTYLFECDNCCVKQPYHCTRLITGDIPTANCIDCGVMMTFVEQVDNSET